jgi:hypothetical protein
MEKYLNKGIKAVIDQFPEIETILEEYDISHPGVHCVSFIQQIFRKTKTIHQIHY